MTVREILARRAQLQTEARSLHAANPDQMPVEQQTRFDAIRTELDGLTAQEQRQAAIDEFDRRAVGQPVGGTGDDQFDQLAARVGLLDVIRAGMGASDEGAGRAREVSAELERRSGRKAQGILWNSGADRAIERRVLTTTTPAGTPGANVIGQDFRPQLFVDRLRNATLVRQLGATVISDLKGPLSIPRQSASVVAGWVPENTAFPVSDPGFDQVTLNIKHCGVITEFSRNMIFQASPNVEQLARNDMSKVLAEALDGAAIAGTGTNAQPTGILNTLGIGSVSIGPNGGALVYNNVADLLGQVDGANGTGQSMAFVGNTKVKRAVAKMVDSMADPLGFATVFQGQRNFYTNLCPSTLTKGAGTGLSALIYGNWSDLIIGFWSELDILVNPYESTAYGRGGVSIRAVMSCDIGVRHARSFAAITDIAA